MAEVDDLQQQVSRWARLLGSDPTLGPELESRGIWPVVATDGGRYVLKRVGPWRNLPLPDQDRILQHLDRCGVEVAGMLRTDEGRLHAGAPDDSFILVPYLEHDGGSASTPRIIGRAVADLHLALATYPRSAHSYTERFLDGLTGELDLPADIQDRLIPQLPRMLEALEGLPTQLVHGDLTPDNVLLSSATRRAAFIDLDHLPIAPRIWDLARFLSRIFRRRPAGESFACTTALIESYQEVSRLSSAEISAIPPMIATMHILEAEWTRRILRGELDRPLLAAQRAELDPMLDALRWHLGNEEQITAATRQVE